MARAAAMQLSTILAPRLEHRHHYDHHNDKKDDDGNAHPFSRAPL